MLVGTQQQAINAWAAGGSSRTDALLPRLLNDGTYVTADACATDTLIPSGARTELAGWTSATPTADKYQADPFTSQPLTLVTKVAGLDAYHAGRRGAVTMPDPAVMRFEVQPNDFAQIGDSTRTNRRSEFVAANDRYNDGQTVWSSFAVVMGPCAGLRKSRSDPQGLVHQWHSVDTTVNRSPSVSVDCSNDELKITTRSDDAISPTNGNGIPQVLYTTTLPAQGTITYIVLQVLLGEVGHINAWVNGTQVIERTQPIGYWTDALDGRALAYPHWGLYSKNDNTTDVVYIANPEIGTADLTARIATPLSVPDLSPWS